MLKRNCWTISDGSGCRCLDIAVPMSWKGTSVGSQGDKTSDTAVSGVPTRAQEDGPLFGSIGNVVSREIELHPLDVRIPVSGVEVKRAQGTISYSHG